MTSSAPTTLLGDERYARRTRSDSVYILSPLDATGLRTVLTAAEQATPVEYEDGLVDDVDGHSSLGGAGGSVGIGGTGEHLAPVR